MIFFYRRFQAHVDFVILSFGILRRENVLSKVNLHKNRSSWIKTKTLLQSLTPQDLEEASQQQQKHEMITNSAVRDLLKYISRIGFSAAGSDEKRSYMLVELKSSMVYWGCPIIYITLNPGDLHSPLA